MNEKKVSFRVISLPYDLSKRHSLYNGLAPTKQCNQRQFGSPVLYGLFEASLKRHRSFELESLNSYDTVLRVIKAQTLSKYVLKVGKLMYMRFAAR